MLFTLTNEINILIKLLLKLCRAVHVITSWRLSLSISFFWHDIHHAQIYKASLLSTLLCGKTEGNLDDSEPVLQESAGPRYELPGVSPCLRSEKTHVISNYISARWFQFSSFVQCNMDNYRRCYTSEVCVRLLNIVWFTDFFLRIGNFQLQTLAEMNYFSFLKIWVGSFSLQPHIMFNYISKLIVLKSNKKLFVMLTSL